MRVDSLRNLESQPPLDEIRRFVPVPVVQFRHTDPPQLEHIAKPFGCDQGCVRTTLLENRVGGHRRAVDHFPQRSPVRGALLEHSWKALSDRAAVVVRTREHLPRRDDPVVANAEDVVNVPPMSIPRRTDAPFSTFRKALRLPRVVGASWSVINQPDRNHWPDRRPPLVRPAVHHSQASPPLQFHIGDKTMCPACDV